MNLFPDWRSLATSGYLFRIVDTADTADRVTIMFSDGDYLASDRCGGREFSQGGQGMDPATFEAWTNPQDPTDLRSTVGCDLASADLSDDEKAHILRRVNEGWADALDSVARRCPSMVSPDRDGARINEGTHEDAGDGLFIGADGALWIRMDWQDDDRGPFTDPAEALRATLPTEYGLAGPEYHSPAFPEAAQ